MESEDYGFHDILLSAEQLTSEIESTNELPKVQRNFRQVLEAAQTLHNRTVKDGVQTDADIRATIFLGTKGVDVTKMQQKLEPFIVRTAADTESSDSVPETDIDSYLKNERMNALCSLIDTCNTNLSEDIEEKIWQELEDDWKTQKKEVMALISRDMAGLRFESRNDVKISSHSPANPSEATYIAEINHYNQAVLKNIIKPNLFDRFEVVAQNMDDLNLKELWSSVVAMASGFPAEPGVSISDRRGNPSFQRATITRAKKYLEKTFYTKLQNDVWTNLGSVRSGSEPSIVPLVLAYITLKGVEQCVGLEIGAGDAGPLWAVVYFCLRCGKTKDAANYMRDVIGNIEMAAILDEYDSSGLGLSSNTETKIRLEYRRVHKNSSRDVFKLAVYCILGACDITDDHQEVAVRLDDYLWLKLAIVRDNVDNRYSSDVLTYPALQNLILEKYGETYFDAFQQPYVYFEALILTGQFEPAIDFLSRIGSLRCHAVHIAIALQENSLLLTSGPKDPMLTRNDLDPAGLRRLNFCHLILSYSKILQSTSLRDAINYLYFLRNMNDEDGVDLFSVCVSEIVADARDFSLFGSMNEDGCRTPGLLETMGINVQPIILFCAMESENRGMFEDAVVLYDLGNRQEKALTVLNRIISQVVTSLPQPDSQRSRIQTCAINLAERYQKQPPSLLNRTVSSTFYLLIDCMTFFDEFYGKRYENSLAVIERLGVIPLRSEDTERSVDAFHSYSEEIRVNIPDLILATMEALLHKYTKLKLERRSNTLTSDGGNNIYDFLSDVRNKAKALVTYCGMIPYFMTGDVYAKVMQMEVQMS